MEILKMRLIAQLAFAVLTVFGGAKAHAFSQQTLINLMSDVSYSYSWQCSGYACDRVWEEMVRNLNSLSRYVDDNLLQSQTLDRTTGSQANRVANSICVAYARGSQETMLWIISAENRALQRLKYIQQLAGVPVRECRKVLL